MAAPNCGCPPLDGVAVCSSLPLAFVRLRYFFGKRLGVADFVDEQLYHAAKMQFHNQRLHGAGVVCGLRVAPFSTSGLRVSKGAALDRCGREIVVGVDQCIDIDAWIARELRARKAVNPHTTWPEKPDGDLDNANRKIALCVVLRYRECTTSPEPAPRDPCACDNGGCDFGRIREGFELDLRTQAQAMEFVAPTEFPAPGGLSRALAQAVSGVDVNAALATLVTAPAPDPTGEEWLVIGCIKATLDNNEKTTAVELLAAPAPPVLLETAVLQELLLRILATGFEPGALVDGAPQVVAAALASENGANKVGHNNAITFTLSGPIAAKTLPASATLHVFDGIQWSAAPTSSSSVAFNPGPPAASIEIDFGDLPTPHVGASNQYRVVLPSVPATPVCDVQLRPLLPLRLAWDFVVDKDGNVTSATFA